VRNLSQDREFGLQFCADLLNSTAPTTKEGIEKYLGSGMVKGIGPVCAKKLVAKFGEKIFDIIEHESGRLEDRGKTSIREIMVPSQFAQLFLVSGLVVRLT
jgi:5'-3' exonuclease